MLRIIIDVDAPAGTAIGVKESFAMDAEKYGDVRKVDVREIEPEQLKMNT